MNSFEEKLEDVKKSAVSTCCKKERSVILPANHKQLTFSYQQPRYINIVETKTSSNFIPSASSSSNKNVIDIENAPDINYQDKT